MRDQNSYIAHLIAQQISENFLLAYSRAESGDDTTDYSRDRGVQTVRELAAHLGFTLVPAEQSNAPTAVSEPSNVVQIGDHSPEYVQTLDTVASIVGAPQFDGAA